MLKNICRSVQSSVNHLGHPLKCTRQIGSAWGRSFYYSTVSSNSPVEKGEIDVGNLKSDSNIKGDIQSIQKDISLIYKTTDNLDKKIDDKLASLNQRIDDKFGSLNQRIDDRFDSLDKKFTAKLESLDKDIKRLDDKFGSLDKKFDDNYRSLDKKFDENYSSLKSDINSLKNMTGGLIIAVIAGIIVGLFLEFRNKFLTPPANAGDNNQLKTKLPDRIMSQSQIKD